MNISLKLRVFSKRFLKIQITTISIILLLSFLGNLFKYFGFGRSFGLGFFFVDAEGNISTWYASVLLLLCAILLSIITFLQIKTRERYVRHWKLLTLIFLYLSIDEAASLHEQMNAVGHFIKLGGLLYFSWVIPAIFMVSIFIIFYLKFLAQLNQRTRRLFCLSGIVYIIGAVGFEMIGGVYLDLDEKIGLAYLISSHFEEGMELLGLAIFIYTLLDYLHFKLRNISVCIEE